ELTLSHVTRSELCALAALEMPRLTDLTLLYSSGLSQVTIDAAGRNETGMRAMACAPWFGRLRSITIDCDEPPISDDFAGCGAPCLCFLDYRCSYFSDAAAAVLGQLALPSLRGLHLFVRSAMLPPFALTARGMAALLAVEGVTSSLEELCLTQDSNSEADADAVVAAIACAPLAALRSLDLTDGLHTDASIASLARACWARQLSRLYLISVDGRFYQNGAAWRALAAAPLESLQELYLHFAPCMSAGVAAHLMSAPWLGGLERLYLIGLSRGAFEVLQASPAFASLQAIKKVTVSQVEREQAAVAHAVGAAD
ncbi:hypothetical protein MNEG_10524, partial [Monoraphidium neglectum]